MGALGTTSSVLTFTLWESQKERVKGVENVFDEIMAENFPKPKKETDFQVQKAQRVPNKMNPNRPTPRYIKIIKMVKVKENFKGSKKKKKDSHTREPSSANFSAETSQARRELLQLNIKKPKQPNKKNGQKT